MDHQEKKRTRSHGGLLFSSPGSSSVAYLVSHNRSVGYRERRCGFNTKHQGTKAPFSPGARRGAACSPPASCRFRFVYDSPYQSTLDAVYVCVVPWSEFPSVPSYSHICSAMVGVPHHPLLPSLPTPGARRAAAPGGRPRSPPASCHAPTPPRCLWSARGTWSVRGCESERGCRGVRK